MKKINFIVALSLLCALIVMSGCTGNGQPQIENSASGQSDENAQIVETASAEETVETPQLGILIEPEQLISEEEAESLLGVAVEVKKTENEVVGQKLCFYSEALTDSGAFLQIGITQQAFMPEGSPNTPESIFETTKEAFGGESAVVDGPGDETILVSGGYYILCDGYMLQISAGNTDDADTIAMLDAASEIAVDNLRDIIE